MISLGAARFAFVAGSRDRLHGVLYVDFRDPRKFVSDRHVEFFASAALLFGALYAGWLAGRSACVATSKFCCRF